MLYLLLSFLITYLGVRTYIYTKSFFDDGIDYDSNRAESILHKHLHNTIITERSDKKTKFYQFHNIKIPTQSGHQVLESVFITPYGIFIFNPIHFNESVTLSDIGYTTNTNNNFPTKLFISSIIHKPSIDSLYQYLPQIDNLVINYYTVITSDLIIKTQQPKNIITLAQISNIIDQDSILLNIDDIHQIIGHLSFLSSVKTIKPNTSLSA